MENKDVLDRQYSISLWEGLPPTEVMCSVASYTNNGTLAIQLFNKPDMPEGFPLPDDPRKQLCEPFGVVTVNLFESGILPYNVQFVDENNLPGIGAWLRKNGMYEAYSFKIPQKDLKEIIERRNDLGYNPMGVQFDRPQQKVK